MTSLIDILVENRKLQSDEAFIAYENALRELIKAPKKPRELPRLIFAFCDVEDHEGMWPLLHFIESFPVEDYLSALVEVTPQLPSDGREWWRRLYRRILRSEQYRQYLKTILPNFSQQHQNSVRAILEHISENVRDPELREEFEQNVAFVLSYE
ncbi:MAG: hypothetical protein GC204_05540 [Chloroflexi bacterium]|nr:hypothetical protein [Chloroflexota bacterium]